MHLFPQKVDLFLVVTLKTQIRPYLDLDHKTANTTATSIVHSKLDYCNSLYYNLPNTQLNRLQHFQNFLACAIVKVPNPPI